MARRLGETSYHETAFGIIPRSQLIPLEVQGIKRAWDFILQKRNKGKIPFTTECLKKIHCVGFGWIFPETAGRFRTVDVEVSAHRPPKFYLVSQLVLDFCRDLSERVRHLVSLDNQNFINELIELLAWAHHRFLWIHPFRDYNGRMARLVNNILLLNLDLPPIELHVETKAGRKRYIHALAEADSGNLRALEGIIRVAVAEAVRELERQKSK